MPAAPQAVERQPDNPTQLRLTGLEADPILPLLSIHSMTGGPDDRTTDYNQPAAESRGARTADSGRGTGPFCPPGLRGYQHAADSGRSWRDRKSTRLNSSHVAISYA